MQWMAACDWMQLHWFVLGCLVKFDLHTCHLPDALQVDPKDIIFRGLNVRMAIATGLAEGVQVWQLLNLFIYFMPSAQEVLLTMCTGGALTALMLSLADTANEQWDISALSLLTRRGGR